MLEELVTEELDVNSVHSQAVIGDGVFGGGQNRFSGDWSEFEDCLQSNVSDEGDIEVELSLNVSCAGSVNRVLNAVREVAGGVGDSSLQSSRPQKHSFCKGAGCGFNVEVMCKWRMRVKTFLLRDFDGRSNLDLCLFFL